MVVVVIPLGRGAARVYVDYLWYTGLGRTDVFWGVRRAQITMFLAAFAVFGALACGNLFVADRLAPRLATANMHPLAARFHELVGRRTRLVRYAAALALAVAMAVPASTKWQLWMLYRHRQTFGTSDAQFGLDAGFYVFELPFFEYVLNWLFIGLLIVVVLVALTHVLNGGVTFASAIPTVRAATRGHVAVLLGILALVRAVGFWVARYATTNDQRGFVQGATYAVVKAQIPAFVVLAVVGVVTGGLFVWSSRRGSWRLPIIASGVWAVVAVLGAVVLPAAVQSLVVTGNQQQREAPYLERNIAATREAMSLEPGDVTVRPLSPTSLNAATVAAGATALGDVRLLNPSEFRSRFQVDRGDAAGLSINDLDVDRYEIDGEMQQVLVAARELDLDRIANKSWQGRHLISTHGCGVVMAPASEVLASDSPNYSTLDVATPELYFSEAITGYAVANTAESENQCDGTAPAYQGRNGVAMSSWLRRAAFAVAFLDYNVLASGAIESDSQMLWVRSIEERIHKLAPFLTIDGDPYPVAHDDRIVWIVDGYTTSARYPYAQRIGEAIDLTSQSRLDRNANYVRNSVKVVVDAYDGSVDFYVSDPDDPIIAAWSAAFGEMFQPIGDLPGELAGHLRYPEDLFRIRTEMYSKYRLDASAFFERAGAWSVAQAPGIVPRAAGDGPADVDETPEPASSDFASEAATARFSPYYTYFTDPATGARSFVLLRPFVPFSSDDARTELQALATASNSVGNPGHLTIYQFSGELPAGPLRVAEQIEGEPSISETITLQNQAGSRVWFGDLQAVPIAAGDGTGLIWVRPFYVSVAGATKFQFVTVNHGGNSAIGPSIGAALAELFPGLELDVGDRVGGQASPVEPPAGSPTGTSPGRSGATSPEDLLTEADRMLRDAEEQLRRDGDLGAYQDSVRQAADLVEQALDALN